ncbi:MAG: PstS family phosphate ABC transporter substrate-binding protein [Oscillospiraceae bacterium]|jgi:phosphate transport system substrate-binding protein|nr:PstS family phosphate ABC transporter substrate-binding protein [Oscillospiraceae bacterium]
MKSKIVSRIIVTLLCIFGAFVLIPFYRLVFTASAAYIFGAYGIWLPIIVPSVAFVIAMLYIWNMFNAKVRRVISLVLVGAVVLFAGWGCCYNIVYKNTTTVDTNEGEMSLLEYEPFRENTLAASLDGESTLKIEGELPILDGATALYPLYSAFARAAYPEDIYRVYDYEYTDKETNRIKALSSVICQTTGPAFTSLINGDTDIAFLAGISKEQQAAADALGVELKLTPIGREAFVFFVNKRNKINGVTSDDITRIYAGEVTRWSEVGGKNDAIRAYQRPEGSGSQTRLLEIMEGKNLMQPPEEQVFDGMGDMYKVVASYKNYKNSLGYSFLYYLRDMIGEDEVKFLEIDGVAPTTETIASGEYPYTNDFYAVTVSNPTNMSEEKAENIEKLLGWICSVQGQSLVEKTGYVPIN